MIALQSHDNAGRGCYPSIETISNESGIADRARIYATLKLLEQRGFLLRQPGRRTSYFLTYEMPKRHQEACQIGTTMSAETAPAYKERELPNELPNRTTAQAPSSAQVDDVSRFDKSTLKRIPPGNEETAATPRRARSLSPREQTIRDLAAWFESVCFAPRDTTKRAFNMWGTILDRYNGDVGLVQTVCKEAYSKREQLCTDEYPVWGLHTVWFYIKYKRKDVVVDHAKELSRYIFGDKVIRVNDVRDYIKLHSVSEQTVRGVFNTSILYRQVFPENGD
jgi:hypothetical protein